MANIAIIFTAWSFLVIISLLTMMAKEDGEKIVAALFVDTFHRTFFVSIFLFALLYIYLPFTIPQSVKEIFEHDEENRESD